jgi:hypothetical protein
MDDRILSQESGIAPYETFFHDFDLEAYSFFNYWTEDEDTNDTLELENRDINEMPRFVKLVWNQAPDLPEEKQAYDKLTSPSKMRSSIGPVVPGSKEQFIVDGIAYSLEQLGPRDFSQIVNSLANSDIAPGVVNSVVTLPLVSSGITTEKPAYEVDHDNWYDSPSSDGVPLNEVDNSLLNRTSGYVNLTSIFQAGVSARNASVFQNLFSGQFTFSPSSFVRRETSISSVNASSPSPSMRASPASTVRPRRETPINSIFNQISRRSNVKRPDKKSINVSFVDTGIGNALKESRVNVATDASHLNSMAAVGQSLKYLVSYSESGLQDVKKKITLRSFEAPNGLSSKEYVGYLIEKYEQVDGVFVLKDLIGIGDPYVDYYYDTKVRYGGVYRYRIKAVMRWVRPKNIGAQGSDPTNTSDLDSSTGTSNTSNTSLTPNFISYFAGEWSQNWATAQIIDDEPPNPPDQLEVRPNSKKKCIVVTFQIPDNSQRDIWEMTLWRRIIDKNGRDVESWREIADFDMSRPGYYEDDSVDFIPFAEETNAPQPFRYVYAVTSNSIHNGESLLSEQIGARLNPEWEQKGEFPVEFYSSQGVHREHDNGIFSTIPIKKYKTHMIVKPANGSQIREPAKITLSCQERWGNRMLNGNKYILRVHSLDTGETFDVDFSTQMVNLNSQKLRAPSNIYVPSVDERYVYERALILS